MTAKPKRGLLIGAVSVLLVGAAILLDTKFVTIGSENDVRAEVFSPETFGASAFPRTQVPVWREKYPGVEALTVAVMGCINPKNW